MTMPLVSETPESAAEPWRNNLRGELHTNSPACVPRSGGPDGNRRIAPVASRTVR